MEFGFPTPGYELTYLPDEAHKFGFDIYRCFYLDDFAMAGFQKDIQWSRSGTLGTGVTHCDFRWECVLLD
jgi:hypothetical protein